eukprot:m.58252 g.58252  ORF g.58252 m.58252 type:complete len:522 (-) comp7855_c2_seq1:49-1614(-)
MPPPPLEEENDLSSIDLPPPPPPVSISISPPIESFGLLPQPNQQIASHTLNTNSLNDIDTNDKPTRPVRKAPPQIAPKTTLQTPPPPPSSSSLLPPPPPQPNQQQLPPQPPLQPPSAIHLEKRNINKGDSVSQLQQKLSGQLFGQPPKQHAPTPPPAINQPTATSSSMPQPFPSTHPSHQAPQETPSLPIFPMTFPPPPLPQQSQTSEETPSRSAPPPPTQVHTHRHSLAKQKSHEITSLSGANKSNTGGFARLGVSGPTISGPKAQDPSLRRSWSVSLAKGRRSTLESRRLLANDKTARLTSDLLGLRPQLRAWRDSAGQESALVLQHSGQLMKISKGKAQCRWFFLFDKILVYCKREKNKLELKGTLEMRDVTIKDVPDGAVNHNGKPISYTWEINNIKKNKWYTLFASCASEKATWLRAFEREKSFNQPFNSHNFKIQITRSPTAGFGFDLQEEDRNGLICSVASVNHPDLCPGLRVGDIFIQFNGISLAQVDMKDLIKMLYLMKPKQNVDCIVRRDG